MEEIIGLINLGTQSAYGLIDFPAELELMVTRYKQWKLTAEGEMKNPPLDKAKMLKRIAIVFLASIFFILIYSCGQEEQGQDKELILTEMQLLIQKKDYEAARLAAVDALDPDIRMLYYDADKRLGHASHLDVRCNERIEEVLYEIVRKVPAKDTQLNRDIYSELVTLSPENKLYRKKFIYYDRKARGMIK